MSNSPPRISPALSKLQRDLASGHPTSSAVGFVPGVARHAEQLRGRRLLDDFTIMKDVVAGVRGTRANMPQALVMSSTPFGTYVLSPNKVTSFAVALTFEGPKFLALDAKKDIPTVDEKGFPLLVCPTDPEPRRIRQIIDCGQLESAKIISTYMVVFKLLGHVAFWPVIQLDVPEKIKLDEIPGVAAIIVLVDRIKFDTFFKPLFAKDPPPFVFQPEYNMLEFTDVARCGNKTESSPFMLVTNFRLSENILQVVTEEDPDNPGNYALSVISDHVAYNRYSFVETDSFKTAGRNHWRLVTNLESNGISVLYRLFYPGCCFPEESRL